jgi:hypothetical protein
MANLIIHRFDVAQESRELSNGEWWLRKTLKLAILALSSLERTMAHQRSRIHWLQDGDANTKLFHIVANGRRNKTYIAAIKHGEEIITAQDQKEKSSSRLIRT